MDSKIKKEVDSFLLGLDEIADSVAETQSESLLKKIEQELHSQSSNSLTPLNSKLEFINQNRDSLRAQFTSAFSDREGRHEINRAIQCFIRCADEIENGETIKNELLENLLSFFENPSKAPEDLEDPLLSRPKPVLSDESLNHIYRYACQRYQESEGKEDACLLFFLLTELNPYLFEPWLCYGICLKEQKKYSQALTAFAMASLMKYEEFAPHLYSAQCYLGLDNPHLAKETLNVALSLAKEEQLSAYKDLLMEIQAVI